MIELYHLDVLLLLAFHFEAHVIESSVGELRLLIPNGFVSGIFGFLLVQLLLVLWAISTSTAPTDSRVDVLNDGVKMPKLSLGGPRGGGGWSGRHPSPR